MKIYKLNYIVDDQVVGQVWGQIESQIKRKVKDRFWNRNDDIWNYINSQVWEQAGD